MYTCIQYGGRRKWQRQPTANRAFSLGFRQAALGGLRQWLAREAVDLTPLLGDGDTCPPEEEDLALLRFLRHNAWDVELTRAQVCGFFSFISIDCQPPDQ